METRNSLPKKLILFVLSAAVMEIFSYGGHAFFTIRTTKGDRTFQIYHWHTDNLNGFYLAYVIIDGVRYSCYDRALIKTLEALEDKYIEAMEAAE